MTLQQAYNQWVDTSPVSRMNTKQKIEVADTIRKYAELRSKDVDYAEVADAIYAMDLKTLARENSKKCCPFEHHEEFRDGSGRIYSKPKPDHMVCARERTWRRYVRIRDGLDVNTNPDATVN